MGDQKFHAYVLVCFGNFLDWKIVEFLDRLPDGQVCDGCGVVAAKPAVLPCMHTSCLSCNIGRYGGYKCTVHKQEFSRRQLTVIETATDELLKRNVRCLSASNGCNFTGPLGTLGNHFPLKCDFAHTICSFCGSRTPFKGLRDHYVACRATTDSAPTLSANFKRLLEDLSNAKKELEAVSQSSGDDGAARANVNYVLLAVDRLRAELGGDEA